MTADLLDPWLVARSRALHAELATATQDARGDIMERHARAAVAERPGFVQSDIPEADMVTVLYSACLRADDPDYDKKWLAGFMEMWMLPRTDSATMTPEQLAARQVGWRKHLVDIGVLSTQEAEHLLPLPRSDIEGRAAFYASLLTPTTPETP